MAFGFIGSMHTHPGKRDEVAQILIAASADLSEMGCSLYAVALDTDDETLIWVTELWEGKEAHDLALQSPQVKAHVMSAMPMIAGPGLRATTDVAGGLGVVVD